MWPRRNTPAPKAHSSAVDELRAAAERHQPDEARIWARVETHLATDTTASTSSARDVVRFPAPWSRVLMATLATMVVAGSISTAAWQLTERTHIPAAPSPAQPQVPVPPPPSAQTSTATQAPSPRSSGPASATEPKGSLPVSVTGTPGPQSYPYWAQNDVNLKVGRRLGELSVSIRVRRTARVSSTGSWLSLPSSDFRVTTETSGDAIVYRWTLLPGRMVPPGSYVMAAQYNRGADHDPGKDTFTMRSGATILTGHF